MGDSATASGHLVVQVVYLYTVGDFMTDCQNLAMADHRWKRVRVEAPDVHGLAHLTLNRPERLNAVDSVLFDELPAVLAVLDADPHVRIVVLNANGRHFCAGIDLSTLADAGSGREGEDAGRARERFRRDIIHMQAAFTALEECRKPVVAAIHGACVGAGLDMVTACDLRYCTEDALFSVKEVDLAITADLGTLQRLPRIVGEGRAMELALTGKRFNGKEAKTLGLVNDAFASRELMMEAVGNLATEIADKSPLAVIGTKAVLLKSRHLSVAQGLDYVATWNAAMLMSSQDATEALEAQRSKRKPQFSKL